MKITIEIPDTTQGIFFNYVFVDDFGSLRMDSMLIGTDDIESGEVFVCNADCSSGCL